MPPCFITFISRSSSGLVTAGPNHHHRIMILESSGGLWKSRCKSTTFRSCARVGLGTSGSTRAKRIASINVDREPIRRVLPGRKLDSSTFLMMFIASKSPDVHSSTDLDHETGGILKCSARQRCCCLADILGSAQPMLRNQPLVYKFVVLFTDRRDHVGDDYPRPDFIDIDSDRRQSIGENSSRKIGRASCR